MRWIFLLAFFAIGVYGERELAVRYIEPVRELDTHEQPVRVCVVCGVHAREFYTVQICERLRPMSKVRFMIVDEANPDGLRIAKLTPCWRGNARGVDLNRNFPHPYRNYRRSERLVREEEYDGESAFSEWETRALAARIQEFAPDVLLSIHSGEIAVLIPYDGASTERFHRHEQHKRVADRAFRDICSRCNVGSASRLIGYEAFGTLADYAVRDLHVPFVYTLETFFNASATECADQFNPSEPGEREEVATLWAQVFIPVFIDALYEEIKLVHSARTLQMLLRASD
jgi:hypothetical protein